jgi:transcriptional regulator with XRE-family HTH domain
MERALAGALCTLFGLGLGCWVKSAWQRDAFFLRDSRDGVPPEPRHPVFPPHINRVPLDRPPGQLCNGTGHCGSAAEFGDQFGCGMIHRHRVQRKFGQSSEIVLNDYRDDSPRSFGDILPMEGTKKDKEALKKAAGKRLRQWRIAQTERDHLREFAATTGVEEATLSAWETGAAMVPSWYVLQLYKLFGLTPNWIILGRLDDLPQRVRDVLAKQQEQPFTGAEDESGH